jgi:hypothetical protein
MTNFKIIFSFLFLTTLIGCGRNEPKEKIEQKTNLSKVSKIVPKTIKVEKPDIETTDSGLAAAFENQLSTSNDSKKPTYQGIGFEQINTKKTVTPAQKQAETVINSPLRNLLNSGQLGKSYSKKELIEHYKFPKEAVDLIKQVTYIGTNKLYFKWGSTWLVEKVSDAEFENDTLIFTFKQNKTYVSGGAIGIKYNKKIYTELILNKGTAYIPSVKGYHWDIGK